MKRVLRNILLVFLFIGVFVTFINKDVNAYQNPVVNKSGVGYSINAVKSKYLDSESVIIGSPVFNENLLSQVVLNKININKSEGVEITDTSFKGVSKKIESSYGYATSISGSYELFTGNASSGFDTGISSSYVSNASQYYYYKSHHRKLYSLSLPNYSSNLSYYRSIVHNDFLYYLNELNSEIITYNQFFEMYGTHIIANGVFGGSLEMYFSAVSNQVVFDYSTQVALKNKIGAGIIGVGEASASTDININGVKNITSNNTSSYFRSIARGGGGFDITNQNDFADDYAAWIRSIDSQEVLIGVGLDGLIPIWEMVPTHMTTLKNKIKSEFEKYAKNHNLTTENNFNCNIFGSTYTTSTKTIRSLTKTIKDTGRFKQHCDKVNLGDNFNISIPLLEHLGYKTLSISIEMQVAEIHDGYQYIFIYQNDAAKEEYEIAGKEFEHVSGKLETDFKTYTFKFNDIDIGEIDNNEFVIRYGASGWFADDWKNKAVKVTISFSK